MHPVVAHVLGTHSALYTLQRLFIVRGGEQRDKLPVRFRHLPRARIYGAAERITHQRRRRIG